VSEPRRTLGYNDEGVVRVDAPCIGVGGREGVVPGTAGAIELKKA